MTADFSAKSNLFNLYFNFHCIILFSQNLGKFQHKLSNTRQVESNISEQNIKLYIIKILFKMKVLQL